MKFQAELKKTSQKKTISNDQVYQLVLETDNPIVMDLGKLPADILFDVEIKVNE